jgi:hypothetical protein
VIAWPIAAHELAQNVQNCILNGFDHDRSPEQPSSSANSADPTSAADLWCQASISSGVTLEFNSRLSSGAKRLPRTAWHEDTFCRFARPHLTLDTHACCR